MVQQLKYTFSNLSIYLSVILAIVGAYFFTWKNNGISPVNFIDGDPEYYYYYLQATFIDSSYITYDWLKSGTLGAISHHPVGVSLLLLPFFLIAYLIAALFHFELNGISLPFQIAITFSAIFYCTIGLIYLKKLFQHSNIGDIASAIAIALTFFGTTLFHYTVVECAMSHVYSFSAITVFMYFSKKFVLDNHNSDLVKASLALGTVLLLRPNNLLIVLSVFIWFNNRKHAFAFFNALFKNKYTALSTFIVLLFAAFQLGTWYFFETKLFSNRYAPYGFYWLKPELINMLFGFDSGFFIYTPMCFLFLFGLLRVFKTNRFSGVSLALFLFVLFYFFSTYSAYTYFDGLGIRVLVDFYSVFAFVGVKLFEQLLDTKWYFSGIGFSLAFFFVFLNMVYTYQASRGILLRAGMTFEQWKYVFLKTGYSYRNCLGGAHELKPYSTAHPKPFLAKEVELTQAFDYNEKDYGVVTTFDSLGFNSNRVHLEISCDRKEKEKNSSSDALICVSLEDTYKKQTKSYFHFRLNETPSKDCCETKHYYYTANMYADFRTNNRLSVFIWNIKKQAFEILAFKVKVYNYNYQLD